MSRRNVLDRAGAAPTKIEKARAMRRDMTLAEARLWAALRRSALEVRVRRQHIVRGWIVDFFIHAAQLVIEVDGDIPLSTLSPEKPLPPLGGGEGAR